MKIGSVDTSARPAIVAEVGNNHEGDVDVALRMVDAAAEAGVDAVKLQAIEPAQLVRPDQTERIAQLERFRLTPEEHARVAERAHEYPLAYVCTPFSLEAVDWLAPLVDGFKIASSDNDHVRLMEAVAAHSKPVIVSSGMGGIPAAERARDVVTAAGAPFAALHCVSAYPIAPGGARLATIAELARRVGCEAGYSDHALGVEVALAAIAAGARIVEKHFTLDHAYSDFRDHALSADPGEMRELCARAAEAAASPDGVPAELLGTPAEGVLPEEEATAAAARRSICAARDLDAGAPLAQGDLTWLRPGDGLAPGHEDELVGRTLVRAVSRGEAIRPGDVR